MSQYFKRISSDEAKEITRQVIAGVLNETESVLVETEKLVKSNVKSSKQQRALFAQIENNLKTSGINVRFKAE